MQPSTDDVIFDDGTVWGYWLDQEGGTWITLPKLPMQKAGLTKPPFDVVRPDGKRLHIIARLLDAEGTGEGDATPSAAA